jgi:hypothetical protein
MVLESKRFVKRIKKEKRKKWDRNQVTELLITKKPFKTVLSVILKPSLPLGSYSFSSLIWSH